MILKIYSIYQNIIIINIYSLRTIGLRIIVWEILKEVLDEIREEALITNTGRLLILETGYRIVVLSNFNIHYS